MIAYDIIIIGGGVAGLSAASFLASRGLQVALIDKGTPHTLKAGECLMADALPIIKRLGFEQDFLKAHHLSLQSYHIGWGNQKPFERHLISSPAGEGWILNRLHFDAMLVKHAKKQNVTFYWETSLQEVLQTNKGDWELEIKGSQKRKLTSTFVIDASGRSRAFTRRLGIAKKQTDKLLATCCHLQNTSHLSLSTATIASDHNGWWYYTKYTKDKGTLAYFTDADLPQFKDISSLKEQAMKQPLLAPLLENSTYQDATFKRLAAYSSTLETSTGNAWLAMGDAVASYDPLSSFGITSALSSAFYGSQAILRYFKGESQYLQTYQQLIQQNFLSYLKKQKAEYEKANNLNGEFWQRRQVNQLHHQE